MFVLNETFGYDVKGCSNPGMSTYSPQEGGGVDLSYTLEVTVYSAEVENLSFKVKNKLVSYMTKKLGYETCIIDEMANTIYVYSINAVDRNRILNYVKREIDPTAIATGSS